jgi:hypothetical protein
MKFLRRALEADQLPLIMRIIHQEWSPISMADQEIRMRIMYAIREVAEKSGWDDKVTLESLRRAEQLNRLAGLPVHGRFRHGFADTYMTVVPLELSAKVAEAQSKSAASETASPESQLEAESESVRDTPAPSPNYQKEVESYAQKFISLVEQDTSLVPFLRSNY